MSSLAHRSIPGRALGRRASLLALVLFGCGSRTGLSLPPPGPVPSQAELDRDCVFRRSCSNELVSFQQDLCDEQLRIAYAGGSSDLQAPYGEFSRPDCALQATDCRSYRSCLNAPYGEAYCAAHPGATCDHNMAVDCVRSTVQDCSASGTTCVPVGLVGMPSTVLCRNTIACTPSHDTLLTCDGNVLTRCDGSLGTGVTFEVCAAGETCHPRRSGSQSDAYCATDGPTCSTWGRHCEGNVVVVCGGETELPPTHRESRFDCARAGYACITTDAGDGLCGPVATECDTRTFVDGCVGTAMHVCVNGQVRSIDCTVYGFAACALDVGNNPICVSP